MRGQARNPGNPSEIEEVDGIDISFVRRKECRNETQGGERGKKMGGGGDTTDGGKTQIKGKLMPIFTFKG